MVVVCFIQVIKAAEDSALQYMNFMNVIFAAQKQVKLLFYQVVNYLGIFFNINTLKHKKIVTVALCASSLWDLLGEVSIFTLREKVFELNVGACHCTITQKGYQVCPRLLLRSRPHFPTSYICGTLDKLQPSVLA